MDRRSFFKRFGLFAAGATAIPLPAATGPGVDLGETWTEYAFAEPPCQLRRVEQFQFDWNRYDPKWVHVVLVGEDARVLPLSLWDGSTYLGSFQNTFFMRVREPVGRLSLREGFTNSHLFGYDLGKQLTLRDGSRLPPPSAVYMPVLKPSLTVWNEAKQRFEAKRPLLRAMKRAGWEVSAARVTTRMSIQGPETVRRETTAEIEL